MIRFFRRSKETLSPEQKRFRLLQWWVLGGFFVIASFLVLTLKHIPGLAAVIHETGPYHPIYFVMRYTLYAVVYLMWPSWARRINPEVREEIVHSTRRTIVGLIVLYELVAGLQLLALLVQWLQ